MLKLLTDLAMANRYLLSFSYLGSHFKAAAKISKVTDLTTVVGALESALDGIKRRFLKDVSPVTLSSRTDAGVHAIQNTAHVDFIPEPSFDTATLIKRLNVFLSKRNICLRISDVRQVSRDFNARKFAYQRTYLYRVGVPKFHDLELCGKDTPPISELNQCFFVWNHDFNLEAVQKALPLFIGTHDFTSFTGRPTVTISVRTPIRQIKSFNIQPGASLMNCCYEPSSAKFNYWDFIVEGRSFNYRQVRRMIGAVLAVARGRLSNDVIERMLNSPGYHQNVQFQPVAPAQGLYLLKVSYLEEHLAIDRVKKPSSEGHLELMRLLEHHKVSLESQS